MFLISPFIYNWKVRTEPFIFIIFLFVFVILTVGTANALEPDGKIIYQADTFLSAGEVDKEGWTQCSHRDETCPDFFIAEQPSLGGNGSLGISGVSNSAANGCWRIMVPGITGGKYYYFEASSTTRGVPVPRYHVMARLDWRNGRDERAGQPEYVPDSGIHGDWQKAGGIFRAPEGAEAVRIELFLRFCEQGTVWWDGIKLTQVMEPSKRLVRVGTINCRPRDNNTSAESVEEFCRLGEELGKKGCDIVCMGEVINFVGVREASYVDAAEPIPGPSTERLGKLARKWNMYIVASLEERDGHAIYCAAILIDRQGRVAGKYRKVTLPREELEGGVTPGNSFPVFDTDFGRIGMMICFDCQYVEPARALAFQGAEVIFWPVWGGNTLLARARAIENQVYIVSSGYNADTIIIDTWGNILAEASEQPGIALVNIDLNETHPNQWLGNMRHRFFRELRTDIHVPGLYK